MPSIRTTRRGASRRRLAVVGLDQYHATGWVASLEHFADGIEIVALHDPDPAMGARLAPRFHDPSLKATFPAAFRDLPFYADLDELLARQQPDLALVTMQHSAAPAAIETLARAGVHMLIDKPAARDAVEAARAFQAVEDAGVRAAVGLTRHFDPAWLEARRLIGKRALGPLHAAEAIFVTSSVRVRDPANHLFDRDRSGHGILLWLGIHDVDGLLWLTGEPVVAVQAMVATAGGDPVAVEDVASVAIRFAGGAIGTLHLAYAHPRRLGEGYVAVRGTGGSVVLGSDGGLRTIGPGTPGAALADEDRHFETPDDGGYGYGAHLQVRDWIDAIETGREPRVGGGDLVRALRVIDAAYESASSGRRVTLG